MAEVRIVRRHTDVLNARIGRRAVAAACATAVAVTGLLVCGSSAGALPLGEVREFPIPTRNSGPTAIVPGPDGDLYFTEEHENKIGRANTDGVVVQEYTVPTHHSKPSGIALGPDGNIWFTESGADQIGRLIISTGEIEEFQLAAHSNPQRIATGPDGNVYFTEDHEEEVTRLEGTEEKTEMVEVASVGRLSPEPTHAAIQASLATFPTPTPRSEPFGITAGPDGNIWFTEAGANKIGRLTPQGSITEFEIENANGLRGIAPGPDNTIWFTERWGNLVGHMSTSGGHPETVQLPENSRPDEIALGPDGSLWVTENAREGTGHEEHEASRIVRLTPSAGGIQESGPYDTQIPESAPEGIAAGADGNVWFTAAGANNIGRVGSGEPEALVSPLTVAGNHEAGSPQTCNASWATWATEQPAASLFGFDGYQWQLNGAGVASGSSFTPSMADVGHTLSCATTVTYPLLDVTTSAASADITIIPPPPALTSVRQSRSSWRDGSRLAVISSRGRSAHGHGHHKHLPPVGTTFTFTLSEAASVRFTFTTLAVGRDVEHKCVTRTRRDRHQRACPLTVTVGALSFTGHEGVNRVVFDGRMSARQMLRPDHYDVTIVASNSTGPSQTAKLGFSVVR